MDYNIYQSIDDLAPIDQQVLEKAREATGLAYAPYSGFFVGAALLLGNQEILLGANQENASYPLSMCAERVALYHKSIMLPSEDIAAIAIVAINRQKQITLPAAPCGACRQVMQEYGHRQGKPFRILLQGESGPIYLFESLDPLLPMGFNADFLLDGK